MKLETLLAERERLAAYGMACALELIDAEIERMTSKSEAPANRQAPARQTADAPTAPGKRPLKSASNG